MLWDGPASEVEYPPEVTLCGLRLRRASRAFAWAEVMDRGGDWACMLACTTAPPPAAAKGSIDPDPIPGEVDDDDPYGWYPVEVDGSEY